MRRLVTSFAGFRRATGLVTLLATVTVLGTIALAGGSVQAGPSLQQIPLAAPLVRSGIPALTESSFPLTELLDEFTSATLQPEWTWLRENPAGWSLTSSPGTLQIRADEGDLLTSYNNASNVLLRPAHPASFEIRTKLTFVPESNGEQAGLIVMQDPDNYVKLVRSRTTLNGRASQVVELTYESLGQVRAFEPITTTATTVYLRLRKQAGVVLGQYSIDNQIWRSVGRLGDVVIENPRLGLVAFSGIDHPELSPVATFDWFRIDRPEPADFDRWGVSGPAVLLDTTGFKMYYTGFDEGESGSLNAIGLATSVDGVSWSRHGSNPVLRGEGGPSRDSGVSDPSVLREGGRYLMWYSGYQVTGGRRSGDVYYATSLDGVRWTRQGRNRDGVLQPVLTVGSSGSWDDLEIRVGRVLKDDGLFRLWYTGRSQSGKSGIGYATSTDGITWQKVSVNAPAIGDGQAPRGVLASSGQYQIWYGLNGAIYTATSPDGLAWTPVGAGPVLSPGAEGEWDSIALGEPWVFTRSGTIQLWYSGGPVSRIGYALAFRPTTSVNLPAIVLGSLGPDS